MKGKRHSEERIIAILKQGENSNGEIVPTARDHGADLLPVYREIPGECTAFLRLRISSITFSTPIAVFGIA